MEKEIIIVRGGGDIATGPIQKLHRAGFRVLVLERKRPLCIRRTISCAQAMFDNTVEIEDFTVVQVIDREGIEKAWQENNIPIIADENGHWIKELKPIAVVDGILAKKNIGTTIDMAPIVIGLGPGFTAGKDVHIVIETMRGHNLARLIFDGPAAKNTGIPGEIGGYSIERILRAPCNGVLRIVSDIGSEVEKGDVVALVDNQPVVSAIDGLVRGMISENSYVQEGLKIGDVDPRVEPQNIYTISDKARAIGGGVLDAVMYSLNKLHTNDDRN